MIHPESWAFLTSLPRGAEALAIRAELDALRESGDRYMVVHQRLTGVLVLTALAAIAAVFADSTPLAQAAILVLAPTVVYGRWRRDDFEREWRRLCYLHGYSAGQLGMLESTG